MQDIDKEKLIELLTDELPVLRAKIGLSQEDVSMIIGISRQTYSAIETKKEK
ncbi:MAG: helix-turn-helix domain-containing protein [Eubacterium sp.]|nr:helix-turn-helix domain-containing protein [Eubacterium sp.]